MNWRSPAQSGFTLIEVVVAMLLLAVMSLLSWQALEAVLNANSRSEAAMQDDAALRTLWAQIEDDLFHLRARPWADGLGGIEPAYMTAQTEMVLAFSRGAVPVTAHNPTGMSRVRYILTDDGLLRRSWPMPASPREIEPLERRLLAGVADIRFEQLNAQAVFVPNWPPLNEQHELDSLPALIRVRIELQDGSTSSRLLPGLRANRQGGMEGGVADAG